jgi:hypothetical protein
MNVAYIFYRKLKKDGLVIKKPVCVHSRYNNSSPLVC